MRQKTFCNPVNINYQYQHYFNGRESADPAVVIFGGEYFLFASHGRFDLGVACKGDTQVDDHHTVEDIGIALGEAFAKALGDKKGIIRYGHMILQQIMSAANCLKKGNC